MAKPAVELPNIHPADELHAVREELAQLQARADELRDILLKEGASLEGDQYTAKITDNKRESVDKQALIEAFGRPAIEPYLRTTTYKIVKITEN